MTISDLTIAARIDRLPISSFHRRLLWIISIPLFFDTSDIFTFSYAAPVLVHRWGLTMSDVALVTSAGFLGMALGGTIGGAVSDRIGRKAGLMLFAAVFSLFSLANGFANNLPFLFVTRLLTGVGISAATVTAITYIAELFPAPVRGKWQSWAMVIAFTGIPITSWVARLVVPASDDGWRWIFIWGAFGLPFLFLARQLHESPRWLARQGRFAEAERNLGAIETAIAERVGPLPQPIPSAAASAPRSRWTSLFGPAYRHRTLTLCAIWFFQTIGFYGFMSWVPTLLVGHGITVVKSLTYVTLMNVGALPGTLITVYLSDRIERKYSIAATALTIAVFGLLYGLTFNETLIVIFGFLVGMSMYTFATLCFAFTPEQYPTDVRNSGTGLAYGVGRLANVINPFIVAALFASFGYQSVFIYIAGAWVLTALIALVFGAKTTGRSLEQISSATEPEFLPPIGLTSKAAP